MLDPFRRRCMSILRLSALLHTSTGRASLHNALYGSTEYVALPLAMLLATPFLLHHLGAARYGIWMLATATITSSGFISTGFGDAALKYAASYRGSNDQQKLRDTVAVNLFINLVLGSFLAALIWYFSPGAVHRLFKIDPDLQATAVTAFRIGSIVLILRSIESVFIGILRAYERYGPAVRIGVSMRLAAIGCAVVVVSADHGITAIMVATLFTAGLSATLQFRSALGVMGRSSIRPTLSRAAFREIFHFGVFSWIQTLAGCIFSYADRLLIGITLGASSVAYYSVCVQAAQPIHGFIAAGLHFLFPHLSARLSAAPSSDLRPVVLQVLALNIFLVLLLATPLCLLSKSILRIWMGPSFAQQAWIVLSIVAIAFALLALNITGHYALLALGSVRLVSTLNVAGGLAMMVTVALLAPRVGLWGAAVGRLLYGPVTLLMYFRLHSILTRSAHSGSIAPVLGLGSATD